MPRSVPVLTSGYASAAREDVGRFTAVTREYLAFLYRYTKPYLRNLFCAFLASVPLAVIGAVLPWAFYRVTKLYGEQASLWQILLWLLIGLGSVSVKSILAVLNKYILTVVHVRVTNDIRIAIYDLIQKKSVVFSYPEADGTTEQPYQQRHSSRRRWSRRNVHLLLAITGQYTVFNCDHVLF